MKKQPQITEQTKNNLRNAFWTLYTKKAIEKISVKEITDLAGYNRGTFYLYYKDVYDIFSQIENDLLDIIRQVLANAKSKDHYDFSSQMEMIIEISHIYSPYFSVLFSDHGDPRFVSRFKELLRPYLEQILFASPDQKPSETERLYICEFYMAGIVATIGKWLETPQISIEQLLNFLLPMIF